MRVRASEAIHTALRVMGAVMGVLKSNAVFSPSLRHSTKVKLKSASYIALSGSGTFEVGGGGYITSSSGSDFTILVSDNITLKVLPGGTVENTGSGQAIKLYMYSFAAVLGGTVTSNNGDASGLDAVNTSESGNLHN